MTVLLAALLAVLPQAASSTIRGRVVDEAGAPIVNARVAVVSKAVDAPVVLTADDGRFAIPVAADAKTTRLTISKTGYGRQDVAADTAEVTVRLARAAAIAGRVSDASGNALIGARVSINRAPGDATQTTSGADAVAAVAAATTDDRGDYRIGGLAAGSYLAAVATVGAPRTETLSNGAVVSYPQTFTTFYPSGDSAASAERLTVAAGDERADVDFRISIERSINQRPGVIVMGPLDPPRPERGRQPSGIGGRAVTVDGAPVAHAPLRLAFVNPFAALTIETDADGRFSVRDLPAGVVTILAVPLAGYVPVESGRRLSLAEGETKADVDIRYRQWTPVTGRITDERGEPIQGASVQALAIRYVAGRRRLVAEGLAAITDDLGRYRLYNLLAGRYAISATAGSLAFEVPDYGRTFYPGTTSAAQAQLVSTLSASEVPGIDFALARTRTARISGRLLGPAGEPSTGGTVTLLPAAQANTAVYVGAGARIENDGQFMFLNVAPGQYVIQASRNRMNRSREGEFGTLPVAVNGVDVTGLVLRTSAGSAIAGRVTFDTRDPASTPERSRVEIAAVPSDPDLSPSQVAIADIHDDWTFEMSGINGPRRLQVTAASAGWTLKEVRVRNVDATDRVMPFGRSDQSLTGVEVVLTDRVSELAGVVSNAIGDPLADRRVVVFSTDRSRWYSGSRFFRVASSQGNGAYAVAGLPFGTYYAAAVAQLPAEGDDAWQDPAFLEQLQRGATTVTVRDGERTVATLRVE